MITIINTTRARALHTHFLFPCAHTTPCACALKPKVLLLAAPEALFEALSFALNFDNLLIEQLLVAAGHEPVVVVGVEEGVDAGLELLGLHGGGVDLAVCRGQREA